MNESCDLGHVTLLLRASVCTSVKWGQQHLFSGTVMRASSLSGTESVPDGIVYPLFPFRRWSGKNLFPSICWSGPLLFSLAIPRVLIHARLCAELVGRHCPALGELPPSLPAPICQPHPSKIMWKSSCESQVESGDLGPHQT